jgi:hypothetical protein
MGTWYDHGQQQQQRRDEGDMDQHDIVSSEKFDASVSRPIDSPSPERSRWKSRWDNACEAPAPPPVWTRYIESRLRQFGGEGR